MTLYCYLSGGAWWLRWFDTGEQLWLIGYDYLGMCPWLP